VSSLPLHLSSLFVFLSALQAILTPDLGIYDFPHFRYFQVFISHGLIVTAALYMTLVEG
jgi:uncharacterized membrane protein YwaF